MAKAKYSYSDLITMSEMSLEQFKEAYGDGSGFMKGATSDEKLQAMLDRAKSATETSNTNSQTWDNLTQEAKSVYDEMYKGSLSYLTMAANVTEEQWNSAYNASVSDNYADGTQLDDTSLINITMDGGDSTEVDMSETQIMKKTKLADGMFRAVDPDNKDFDDFTGEEIGTTRNVAGGTITNLGIAEYGFGETVDVGAGWKNNLMKDYVPLNDEQKGTIVHYEGYLGSFDYNTRDFEIAYYESEVNGNKISVPTLHYIGDQGVDVIGAGKVGITDGSKIHIPEGLVVGDYMFAGNSSVESMPKLPDSLESAHGMFLNATGITKACNDALDADGNLKMPSKLKDISYIFAGCEQMTQSFGSMGEEMLDARYAFADCKKLGFVDGNGKDGEMDNTFMVPDTTHLRYANEEYLRNMFDNSNVEVEKKLTAFVDEYNKSHEGSPYGSAWTNKDGVHNNNYDKLVDGSYDKEKEMIIADESSRQQILRMIDKDGKAVSGVESDTEGLASSAVKITDDGTFADDSTWAKFLQSEFTGTVSSENKFGEILDRAIPAIGTFAVSKGILSSITGGRLKGVTTLGSVAIAAVPQIVGFGNKLTPMLDSAAGFIGPETKVGQFLTNMSDKLKGADIKYSTKVEELNADKTFESMQASAVKYAKTQMTNPFKNMDYDLDGDGEKESVITAATFDVTNAMSENGKKMADDANLLFIACEPEANLKNTMSDGIMQTTTDAIRAKMDTELEAAGNDPEKLQRVRDIYSNYYTAMLYNLSAYDTAAVEEIANQYMNSPELKDQAMNGLGKIMRNTVSPLYDEMQTLQTEWQEKYGIEFFSDRQLNDTEDSLSVKNVTITGLGTFADYDQTKDYSADSDQYVEKLDIYREAFVQAVQNASSQEEIDAAYASYYETAYGWALDEAEAHGVVLDKRGAQTTAEKDSFAEYVAKIEAEQQSEIAESETGSASKSEESSGAATDETKSDAGESNKEESTDQTTEMSVPEDFNQTKVTEDTEKKVVQRVAMAEDLAAGLETETEEYSRCL